MTKEPTYNILIDFDDVIYPFCDGIVAVCAEEGITGEITQWALENDFGMDKESFWEMVYQPKHHETLFLQSIDFQVLNQIRRLRYAGHRLHIVTAREGEHPERFCREVLAREKVPVDTLTFTKDKAAGPDELDATFSLDDGPHNYEALNQVDHLTYLMDAPHNGAFTRSKSGMPVRRVNSMTEFTNTVIGFQQADVQMRGDVAV